MAKSSETAKTYTCEVLVIGSGVSGYCAAIQAGRGGCKTILLEKDEVLGGNSGPNLGVGITGADRYNAYATESGIIQELQEEAAWVRAFTQISRGATPYNISRRNEAVVQSALEAAGVRILKRHFAKSTILDGNRIVGVIAEDLAAFRTVQINVQNVVIEGSGDGHIGALSGADFDMGSESQSEFNERSAPPERRSWVQGTSLVALAHKVDWPVEYIPPPDIGPYTPRMWHGRIGSHLHHHDRQFSGNKDLMFLYVTEAGGDMDTIGEDGDIYEILLKQLWAEWDHIKNGPHKEDARNWDLVWVSPKAGKRESRRFLGDIILTQTDLESGRRFDDDIAYGGHDLDDHQALGEAGSNIFGHSIPPLYGIPYRACYSRNIDNLLLAGRLISATHLAHSSTRLMRTGGAIGQAVGLAASLCITHKTSPRAIYNQHLKELQSNLLERDGTILCRSLKRPNDLAQQATVTASSELRFNDQSVDQMAPLVARAGNVLWDWPEQLEQVALYLKNGSDEPQPMTLSVLHARDDQKWSTVDQHHKNGWNDLSDTAFKSIAEQTFDLPKKFEGWFNIPFKTPIALPTKDAARDADRIIIALNENQKVWWGVQNQPCEICDMIEHSHHDPTWKSLRAVGTMQIHPIIPLGEATNITDGYHRRFSRGPTHMWMSRPQDSLPQELILKWDTPITFSKVELTFDNLITSRHDQPWESGKRVHPIMTKSYTLSLQSNNEWITLTEEHDNYHRFRTHTFDPVTTDQLRLQILETHSENGQVRVYQISVL